MRVFDLATGEPKACFPAAGDTLNGAHFHPSLPLLATASGDVQRCRTETVPGGWPGSATAAQPAPVHQRSAACTLASPHVPGVQLQRPASVPTLPCAGHRRYPLAPSDSDSDERAGAGQPAPGRQGAQNALLVWRFQYAFTPFPEAVAAAACTAEAVQGAGEAEAAAGGAQLPAAAWGAHAGAASGGEVGEAVARTEGLAGAVQAAA